MSVREVNYFPGQMPAAPPAPPPAPSWLAGLDLGMMSDYTALALIEKTVEQQGSKRINRYAVRHLQRWLHVDYPTIAEQLRPMFAAMPSPPPKLIVDATGVGLGVVQIIRRAKLPIARLVPVVITAGHGVNQRPDGGYNVPKAELVAATQSPLQSKRLVIAPGLKEAKTLHKELSSFVVKINVASATESFEAWREGQHDDLVLAVCMGVWFGEQGGQRLTADMFFV